MRKDIVGFEGLYQVDDEVGGVWSNQRKKGFLKGPKVTLCKDGVKDYRYIEELVAEYFVENPDNLPRIIHINGDWKDCRAVNLRWGTEEEYREMSGYYERHQEIERMIWHNRLLEAWQTFRLSRGFGDINNKKDRAAFERVFNKQYKAKIKFVGSFIHWSCMDEYGHKYGGTFVIGGASDE